MGEIGSFLSSMPFWYWWVLAVILLIGEIVTGTTYILWPAAAAVVVGVLAIFLPGSLWYVELFLFALIAVALTYYGTPYLKAWLRNAKTDHENLNERGAQKVGQRAVVEVAFAGGKGKVRFGDTLWLATCPDLDVIETGVQVEIIDVQGTTMVVKKVSG